MIHNDHNSISHASNSTMHDISNSIRHAPHPRNYGPDSINHSSGSKNTYNTKQQQPQSKRNSSQILAMFSSNTKHNTQQANAGNTQSFNANLSNKDTSGRTNSFSPGLPIDHSAMSFPFGDTFKDKENRESQQRQSALLNRVRDTCEDRGNRFEEVRKLSLFNRIEDASEAKENRFQEMGKSSLLNSIGDTCEDRVNRFERTQNLSLFDSIVDGNNRADTLFNKSKKSYSTTPFLETNSPSDWENTTHDSMFQETSSAASMFGIKSQTRPVVDMFEVPDLDLSAFDTIGDDDLSDGVVNELFASNMVGSSASRDKISKQSQQVCLCMLTLVMTFSLLFDVRKNK